MKEKRNEEEMKGKGKKEEEERRTARKRNTRRKGNNKIRNDLQKSLENLKFQLLTEVLTVPVISQVQKIDKVPKQVFESTLKPL